MKINYQKSNEFNSNDYIKLINANPPKKATKMTENVLAVLQFLARFTCLEVVAKYVF